jgi:hypothetical protein
MWTLAMQAGLLSGLAVAAAFGSGAKLPRPFRSRLIGALVAEP